MDNAIKNGQNQGIDGDLLVNVRIDVDSFDYGLGLVNCYEVEGNLIPLKLKKK